MPQIRHDIYYSRKAFTIVEALIALAITGLLLAAVAAAFNASVTNYRVNEDMFKATNSARQALSRITTQVRTAYPLDPNAPANECSLVTAGGEDITYQYNNGNNKLYLITNDDTTDSDYVLCDNVTAMAFTKQTGVEVIEGVSTVYVKSVQMSITVAVGDIEQTLSAAAVVRRNLK